MAVYLIESFQISIRRACRVIELPKSMYYYQKIKDDSAVIQKLQELSERYPSEGQDLYYSRIREQGLKWNYKRVRRVYTLLGMSRRRRKMKRLPARVKMPLIQPEKANQTWSMDFMSDVLVNKRKFRTLNIIDDYNRAALNVIADFSIPACRVNQILERTIREHGKPSIIRVDNGPEFISQEFKEYCSKKGIGIQFIQPGKPMQNGYIERFNRTFRENILDAYVFENIHQVQILAEEWMEDYNYHRPHESLGNKTPMAFRGECEDMENPVKGFPHLRHSEKNNNENLFLNKLVV